MPPTKKPASAGVYLIVSRDGWTGGVQLSIERLSAEGTGYGYRIAGPKFNGSSENLVKHRLSDRDADEIANYLKEAQSLRSGE